MSMKPFYYHIEFLGMHTGSITVTNFVTRFVTTFAACPSFTAPVVTPNTGCICIFTRLRYSHRFVHLAAVVLKKK